MKTIVSQCGTKILRADKIDCFKLESFAANKEKDSEKDSAAADIGEISAYTNGHRTLLSNYKKNEAARVFGLLRMWMWMEEGYASKNAYAIARVVGRKDLLEIQRVEFDMGRFGKDENKNKADAGNHNEGKGGIRRWWERLRATS